MSLPLQNPGTLPEDEYWAISAYMLEQIARLATWPAHSLHGIPDQ